jgi:hypothetical protein
MHPDIARELIRQHVGEMQARAAEARAARDAARARRDQAAAAAAQAAFLPRIPDYVDGTFREAVDRETVDRAHAC